MKSVRYLNLCHTTYWVRLKREVWRLVSGLQLWLLPAFGCRPQYDNHLEQEIFGFSAWSTVLNLAIPLNLFYRMHSVASLFEVFRKVWACGERGVFTRTTEARCSQRLNEVRDECGMIRTSIRYIYKYVCVCINRDVCVYIWCSHTHTHRLSFRVYWLMIDVCVMSHNEDLMKFS